MGAAKKEQFSTEKIEMALLGRAIASPARIAILQHLNDFSFLSIDQLSVQIKLSLTATHQHLKILKDAHLILDKYIWNRHGYYLNKQSKQSFDKINWIFEETNKPIQKKSA